MKAWARDQIKAALAARAPAERPKRSRRAAAADGSLVRCVACGRTETSTPKMDRHCDEAKHRRYEMVL